MVRHFAGRGFFAGPPGSERFVNWSLFQGPALPPTSIYPMPTNSPVPSSPTLLLPWLQNFSLKFPNHGPKLGYSYDQITAAQADCAEGIHLLLNVRSAIQHNAEEMDRHIRLKLNGPLGAPYNPLPIPTPLPPSPPEVPAGIVPRLRALVTELKGKAAYTAAMGADLNIVITPPAQDASPPTLSLLNSLNGQVTLKWSKQGWDGVKVQSRAPGTSAWTDLGTDGFSPFVDTRPLATPQTPEIREYRLCHLDGDNALNNWSDVLVVNVTV